MTVFETIGCVCKFCWNLANCCPHKMVFAFILLCLFRGQLVLWRIFIFRLDYCGSAATLALWLDMFYSRFWTFSQIRRLWLHIHWMCKIWSLLKIHWNPLFFISSGLLHFQISLWIQDVYYISFVGKDL